MNNRNLLKKIIAVWAVMLTHTVFAQNAMDVKVFQGNDALPLVAYISGDGGFNNFTTGLCSRLQAKGYTTVAINARSYFWKKKLPQEAANDFSQYLSQLLASRNNKQLITVGYSFGADVWPFITNRMPAALKKNIKSQVLLAPSPATDFEIHVSEMLGFATKDGMSVIAEINKMSVPRVTIIQAKDNLEVPPAAVKLSNFNSVVLPGNHHFDNGLPYLITLMVNAF